MSNLVPHYRPELSDGDIRAGLPVDDLDWSTMAALANWNNGHGGMLVPWTACLLTVATGTSRTFAVRVVPKNRAVERIWRVNLLASAGGASATITPNGGSAVVVYPGTTRDVSHTSFEIRQSLSAKSSTEAQASLAIQAAGGNITVESIACYEQTRRVLAADATDYGVDVTTLRPRVPIVDLANEQIGGVCDAYQNLDARRSGQFHWSTPTNSAVAITSEGYTSLFALDPVIQPAIPTVGDTTASLRCAVYARVTAGTGEVRFVSSVAGVGINVTSTTFAWVTGDTDVASEDLSAADGRRSSTWETVAIEGTRPGVGETLNIAAVSIFRVTRPV